MTPLWREQAVHAIDVALAEAIYSLAVLPALIQRQTDVPASPTKLLGGADQFNRRWAEQYTAAATSLFGDRDQFSGFLCLPKKTKQAWRRGSRKRLVRHLEDPGHTPDYGDRFLEECG